jgi:hypothetical protein
MFFDFSTKNSNKQSAFQGGSKFKSILPWKKTYPKHRNSCLHAARGEGLRQRNVCHKVPFTGQCF